MRLNSHAGLLAGACLAFAGCTDSTQREVPSASRTNAAAESMKREVREAVDATKVYASENKDQFMAYTQEKLAKLDRQIAELGTKAGTLKDDAKVEGDKALAALREQRATVGEKFDELKKSSQEAWKDVKAGFETAYAQAEKAYEDARSKFQ